MGGTPAQPSPPSITALNGSKIETTPPATGPNQVRFATSSVDYGTGVVPGGGGRRVAAIAVGAGVGDPPHVQLRTAGQTGEPVNPLAYHPGFTGGVRTALAHSRTSSLLATAPGPGGGPHVKLFRFDDTNVPQEIFSTMAYAPGFRGGVWVALGDVTGDRVADLVTGTGSGGGPHVVVIDGATLKVVASFFAGEPTLRTGVTVAVADVDGDGRGEVVAGTGAGGPTVRVFDGLTGRERSRFEAFEPGFLGGVSVAAADLTGDGRADLVVGAGAGGGPVVKAFEADGRDLFAFFAYPDPDLRGGVNVETGDLDLDGAAELITGAGPGGGAHLRAFDAATLNEVLSAFPFGTETRGGLNV